ncbi:hypothetical protein GCM10023075_33580 [Streptosporangium album]
MPGARAQLLSSGTAMRWALDAQRMLADDWEVASDVWSVTSWSELRREAMACDADALADPGGRSRLPYVTSALSGAAGPVIAVSDWMRAVPDDLPEARARALATWRTHIGGLAKGLLDTGPEEHRSRIAC